MMLSTLMRGRWLQLLGRAGSTGTLASWNDLYTDLVDRYSESHRAYHTLEHIKHCLWEFDAVQYLASNRNAVEFALWYHDIMQETKPGSNNEEASARLAERVLQEQGIPTSTIDLAILGQPEERFDQYERDIRSEYSFVPENQFRSVRAGILQGFLDRPSIYNLKHFQDRYEAQARANLNRSIAALTA